MKRILEMTRQVSVMIAFMMVLPIVSLMAALVDDSRYNNRRDEWES